MRSSRALLIKVPRNLHVAPKFDTWNEKHEAWVHLKKMSRLAATGFYIPPAWYQHFRMFPPMQHNFQQEQTNNPQNSGDETQVPGEKLHPGSAARDALRTELAKHARSAAAAGNRYLNQFFVRKPIDEMEKQYNELVRRGLSHKEALRHVLQTYREKQAVRARAHLIQADEAKLSGKFITMREAVAVMSILNTVQTQKLAPHDYAKMASTTKQNYLEDPMIEARKVTRKVKKAKPAAPADATVEAAPSTGAAPAAENAVAPTTDGTATPAATTAAAGAAATTTPPPSASTSVPVLEATGDDDDMEVIEEIIASATPGDSLPKLRDMALDGVGREWYTGYSPEVAIEAPGFNPKP